MAFRTSVIYSIFVVWRHNDQDPMQFPIQPFQIPVVTCRSVYILRFHWPLIYMTLNYMQLQRHR
jgi:hypothetical protein